MRALITIHYLLVSRHVVYAFITPSAARTCCYHCHHPATSTRTRMNGSNKSPQNGSISDADPLSILPQLYTYQKPRQKRQSQTTRKRKPRDYWHSIVNLRHELYSFWEELDVTLQSKKMPPIPSEYLLNYFNRNDLRWGIAQMGGRENVSHLLGGAKIIPGRWEDAMRIKEVKRLLPLMEGKGSKTSNGKDRKINSSDVKTSLQQRNMMQQSHGDELQREGNITQTISTSLQHLNQNATNNVTLMSLVTSAAPNMSAKSRTKEYFQHLNQNATMVVSTTVSTKSETKEFWSKEKVVKELYQYLESYRKYKKRPAVWMPQLAELSHEGYSKLFNACSRFQELPYFSIQNVNDDEDIHSMAGLVPFREWRFFESQLQLFVELQHYLTVHHNGSEEFFPEPSNVSMNGHSQLHDLIRIHGGKTMLAQKLDMKFAWEIKHDLATSGNSTVGNESFPISNRVIHNTHYNLSWGLFSLKFATQLLHLIRAQYLTLTPPLSSSFISMPSEKDLLSCGHKELARQVMLFGGYENVARRLGLAFFDGKSQQMEERRFRRAKLLWKDRHIRSREKSARKRKGLAWDEDLVIRELQAYVNVNMTKRSLPATVMPRFRQLDEDDRGDLRRAISKFGGTKEICKKAGLTPIEDWQTNTDAIQYLNN